MKRNVLFAAFVVPVVFSFMRRYTVLILAPVVLITSTAWSADQLDRLNAGILPTVWTEPPPSVRVLYGVPKDRQHSDAAAKGIRDAILDFQEWLRQETGGKTFSVQGALPQKCMMPKLHDHYATGDAWRKVLRGVQGCAPVTWEHIPWLPDLPETPQTTIWVVFVDVIEVCGEPHELARAGPGITLLGLGDVEKVSAARESVYDYQYCDRTYPWYWGRWVGGVGHELTHALGLPHPPGCETEPTCEHEMSLLWKGFASYPQTYIDADSLRHLVTSPFLQGKKE